MDQQSAWNGNGARVGEAPLAPGEVEGEVHPYGRATLLVAVGAPTTLAALEFIRRFPTGQGLAFVVLTGASPEDRLRISQAGSLPGMEMRVISQGDVPAPGIIYLLPPGRVVALSGGRLLLRPTTSRTAGGALSPLDEAFLELARSCGSKATVVLVPGTGEDGRVGGEALRAAGAGFFVLGEGESDSLSTIAKLRSLGDAAAAEAELAMVDSGGPTSYAFLQIQRLCREIAQVDFSGYRVGDLVRRVRRRVARRGDLGLEQYVNLLSTDTEEVHRLVAELLVSGTSFFYEPSVWERLRALLLPRLVEKAERKKTFRVWVAGCSTGQEAYTIAILIDEILRQRRLSLEVKIFATDVNSRAIARAADGIYEPPEVVGLNGEQMERYFHVKGRQLIVRPTLRKRLIFSKHDVVRDPPFIHLDLLSCRNLLIYLEDGVPAAVCRAFAKAVDDDGLLLLGAVEGLPSGAPFVPVGEGGALFHRESGAAAQISALPELPHLDYRSTSVLRGDRPSAARDIGPAGLLEVHVAGALIARRTLVVVTDAERQIQGMVGESEAYLRHVQGPISRDLVHLVRPELAGPVTTLIERVRATDSVAQCTSPQPSDGVGLGRVRMTAQLRQGAVSGQETMVVIFEPEVAVQGDSDSLTQSQAAEIEQLMRELNAAYATVQTTVQKLEESEHAHKSTREMMMTSNEELQSANEELHSVNQELFAVNTELQNKIDQLTELGSDVDNLLHSTRIATIFVQRDLTIRKFTRSATAIFNLLPHDVGRPLLHLTHRLRLHDLAGLLEGVILYGDSVEKEVETLDGLTFLMRALPYHKEESQVDGVVLTFVDISSLKAVEEALRHKETQLREVINLVPHQLYAKDREGRFVLANRTTAEFFGVTLEDLRGRTELELSGDHDQAILGMESDQRVFVTGNRVFIPEEVRSDHEGKERILQTTKIPIHGKDDGPALLGISLDITEEKRVEAELRHRALYDILTGLPNRDLFSERLGHCLLRHSRRGDPGFALLFLDLDCFKEINDTMGHVAGDELLQAAAVRLRECARPGDTVARLGGDEFAMLLERVASEDVAQAVADRIHQALSEPFQIQGTRLVVSTSIGVALPACPNPDTSALMQQADVAMYEAKRSGPGQTRFFSTEMSSKLSRVMEIRLELHQALSQQQLLLYYQPIVDLMDRSLTGVEVLVRWNHPRRGLLAPDGFLPVARSAGIMCQIDQWVIDQACAQLKAWHQAYPLARDLTMNVNVCGEHLQRTDLVDFFKDVTTRHALPRKSLVVELTESSVLHAPANAAVALGRLREMDIGVALDDFGTGYSSLNHLRQLPLGVLKVDRSFTSCLREDPRTTQIVRSLISLGDALGVKVVAEGVESADQEAILTEFGCHFGQGYLYSRPMDAEAFGRFIKHVQGGGRIGQA